MSTQVEIIEAFKLINAWNQFTEAYKDCQSSSRFSQFRLSSSSRWPEILTRDTKDQLLKQVAEHASLPGRFGPFKFSNNTYKALQKAAWIDAQCHVKENTAPAEFKNHYKNPIAINTKLQSEDWDEAVSSDSDSDSDLDLDLDLERTVRELSSK